MKNKSLTKLTALVLLVTMIALVIISGTFAKYTSEYKGEGTAIVAKWDVSVTDLKGNAYSEDTTINLFDVSKVYDLNGADFAADGTDDTDVANGTDKAVVAPGTWGKVGFVVTVGETTDVTVKYNVDITELTTSIPLKFSTDGTTWVTVDDIKADINNVNKKAYSLGGDTVEPRTADSTKTVTLYWKWDFEVKDTEGNVIVANDVSDTTLGKAGTEKCIIKARLVATQVD